MPFGVRHDDIVVIDRETGSTAHLFPHEDMQHLFDLNRRGDGVEITDAVGTHHYPSAAVLGLHFQTAPNYTEARVELWQDNYGIGAAGEAGAARLYVVDPWEPYQALPIHTNWLTRATFRTIAAQLVEGALQLTAITDTNAPTIAPRDRARVAVWHQQSGLVTIDTERRGFSLQPVAGPVATNFIGLEDMNADARRPQ